MTDNILYLDEQGYPCDDYKSYHIWLRKGEL